MTPQLHRQKIGPLQSWILDSHLVPAIRKILADPDDFIQHARILKHDPATTVAATDGLVLKRFNRRAALSQIKNIVRPSKARRALLLAIQLQQSGIPVPTPIAAAELRHLRFLQHSYFLMRELAGAVDLPAYRGNFTTLAARLGTLIGHLHQAGFSHRDLKQTNIMVAPNGQPHLVDIEGIKFVRVVSRRTVIANLTRLARGIATIPGIQPIHRAIFIRHYCRTRNIRPGDLR